MGLSVSRAFFSWFFLMSPWASQLWEGVKTSTKVGVVGAGFAVGGVQLAEGFAFGVDCLGREAFGVVEIANGLAGGTENGALVFGGEIAAAPLLGAGERDGPEVRHGHEGREVFVGRSEAVGDPGAHGGVAGDDEAGVHLDDGGGVVAVVGLDAADHGEVVDALGGVGEKFADFAAGLAVFRELKGAGDELAGLGEEVGLVGLLFLGPVHDFAVQFD